jgi:hypothetical protein
MVAQIGPNTVDRKESSVLLPVSSAMTCVFCFYMYFGLSPSPKLSLRSHKHGLVGYGARPR